MQRKNTIPSVAYLPATTVLAELGRMVGQVSAVGVLPDDTTVGGSFGAWSAKLQKGQTAWIYSLDRFYSITELMAYNETMVQRGVAIRSVCEPWFNDPTLSGTAVLGHLFRLGEVLHERFASTPAPAVRPVGGSLSDQLLFKAQRAVELRASRKLSVVAACRLAHCGVNAYYRYLKEQQR